MQITAAVVHERGGPFVIERAEIGSPGPSEILVRLVASGICATDLHIRDQEYPVPLPVVAGHEGAGVVEEVGAAVEDVSVGDRVLLSFPFCGACGACRRRRLPYCDNGFALSFGGSRLDGSNALSFSPSRPETLHGHIFQQSSFATHAVVPARSVVTVPEDADLTTLAPLGCGVQTGAGTVLRTLAVPPGSSVAVLGTGTVGLAATMAAVVAGATRIVAVDRHSSRLDLALRMGATDAVDATDSDIVEAVRDLTGGGADYVVDTTANPGVLSDAVEMVAMTGTVALVGGAPAGTRAHIDMNTLLNGRQLRGVIQGDSEPRSFIPQLLALHAGGRFPLDLLITHYDFADIERAVRDLESGATVKPVLLMPA